MKRTFLFVTIASILSINAYAVSTTVTSKDYVDTTRQATIPAAETNYDTPGVSVVTYTDTAGTIGERWICDAELYGDNDCVDDDLVTLDVLGEAEPTGTAGTVPVYNVFGRLGNEERGIYDGSNGYNSSTDADKLVTAGATRPNLNGVYNVTRKVCVQWIDGQQYTDANCLLWDLVPININYQQCTNDSDCAGYGCCYNGICGDCPT